MVGQVVRGRDSGATRRRKILLLLVLLRLLLLVLLLVAGQFVLALLVWTLLLATAVSIPTATDGI